jgi:hypothetical protein
MTLTAQQRPHSKKFLFRFFLIVVSRNGLRVTVPQSNSRNLLHVLGRTGVPGLAEARAITMHEEGYHKKLLRLADLRTLLGLAYQITGHFFITSSVEEFASFME